MFKKCAYCRDNIDSDEPLCRECFRVWRAAQTAELHGVDFDEAVAIKHCIATRTAYTNERLQALSDKVVCALIAWHLHCYTNPNTIDHEEVARIITKQLEDRIKNFISVNTIIYDNHVLLEKGTYAKDRDYPYFKAQCDAVSARLHEAKDIAAARLSALEGVELLQKKQARQEKNAKKKAAILAAQMCAIL